MITLRVAPFIAFRVTTEVHSACILKLRILYSVHTVVEMSDDQLIKKILTGFARHRISPNQNETGTATPGAM